MSERKRAQAALFGITDFSWNFAKALAGQEDTGMHPEYITYSEAQALSDICSLVPNWLLPKLMPFIVRQFGGQEGERVYKDLLANPAPQQKD